MNTSLVTTQTVLSALSRDRLYDLARVFGYRLQSTADSKQVVARDLAALLGKDRLEGVLRELGRDELRAVCRSHSLDVSGRTRDALLRHLFAGARLEPRPSNPPPEGNGNGLPTEGQILSARGRQWLVERVIAAPPPESPLLHLSCLDDDAPGRELRLLWDLELGARVIAPESQGLGKIGRLDPPGHFGAYLHALKWNAVSSADASRFQAPFRAGIKIMPHQLTPLMKALELPRANLFIADDVGLGKTIEAGLVLQELILRQQAHFVLIVCPAAIALQWRDEMMRRFGLRFEVMSRQLVACRRLERGFSVNPWLTYNRFIVSYPLLRRREYRDPLRAFLDEGADRGLLILDEAHTAAPASASKYAIDSDTTEVVRELAPRFDNRLFLSATPHNGHSNSFSALLEILDPARFTRGDPIRGADELAPIMVRRLKRDLRRLRPELEHEIELDRFPERVVVRVALRHGADGWSATEERQSGLARAADPSPLASGLGGDTTDLELPAQLERYTELCAPAKGRGRLVFIQLQKRLLSSPEAFARTLEVHARAVERAGGVQVRAEAAVQPISQGETDAELHGPDEEAAAAEDDAEITEVTGLLEPLTQEAKGLLRGMRASAERARRQPDAKLRALFAWFRTHLCPTIGLPEAARARRSWSDRRVILFTEYVDTKRYVKDLLEAAIAHTERAEKRILVFQGGMGDKARDEIQSAFNAAPELHPVRILIATDAAREGLNLQAHCADLFHLDVPWNPSRVEQRNGRIDRTLQPAAEVRCHYFAYEQRGADRVLETLVRKLETVREELGSVGSVLMDQIEGVLSQGISARTAGALDSIGADARSRTAQDELEARSDAQFQTLRGELHVAMRRLDDSRKALEVDPAALRGVVEVGLHLSGAGGLAAGETTADGRTTFVLPELDRSWETTLDVLRPPRGRSEPFWEWRQRPPRAVTFEPLQVLSEEAEQLHLAHPLVRRILDRFLAQGYGAHDLSRVCAVLVAGERVARAVAYARLTLFGRGATRLHDELIAITAPWTPGRTPQITPYKDSATAARARASTEQALATRRRGPPRRVADEIAGAAPQVYAALWPHLETEADTRGADARSGLARRARKESDDLRRLLEQRRERVLDARARLAQRDLSDLGDRQQQRQIELDLEHLARRATRLAEEVHSEPRAIEAQYEVKRTRLSPVGLAIAWPEDPK